MAKTREIKKRMTAVGTIQRITKTMQMIATAKFTAAVGRTKATQPYTAKIRQLVSEVAAAAGDEADHPLLRGPVEPVRRELILVIASDRGLCGAYNANVLRTSLAHLNKLRSGHVEFDLETSGKKAIGFFRFQKQKIDQRHTIGDKPKYEDVERLAARYIDLFTEGRYDAVRVAYMRFISNARQKPMMLQLLPMKPEDVAGEAPKRGSSATYDFSPSSQELLGELLPTAVKTTLFQAFNEAVVSEQIMRMVAMKAATENAKELGKTLRRDYNRARQTQITTELSEIIAGAAALG